MSRVVPGRPGVPAARALAWVLASALASALACADGDSPVADTATVDAAAVIVTDTARIQEAWVSRLDTAANIDGPAIYHGAAGEHWIIASAKATDELVVLDATNGRELRRVGTAGTGDGQLDRPNGVLVLGDSLLLVVERDNHRVQAFRLPAFVPVGSVGADRLRKPYGLTALPDTGGGWHLYVTDNYETADEQVPPLAELGARVKHFRIALANGRLTARHVRDFGDTSEAGAIRITETIVADPAHDVLLIAEELETDSHIKVYTRDGQFTGRVFGRGLFPQQAEGIALFACGRDGGYWVATDQGGTVNTFHLFERTSFRHVGSFAGQVTNTTDGVALTQRAFGPFPSGAFFAAHADAAIAAISWAEIAGALRIPSSCPSS